MLTALGKLSPVTSDGLEGWSCGYPANLLVVLFECNAYKSEEHTMIGDRLRDLREAKHLSQGDIEKRAGLLRCYVSRVENGHTVPAIETLEKWALALEVPLYQFFYDGDEPPQVPTVFRSSKQKPNNDWASRGRGLRMFTKMRQALSRMRAEDRSLLMDMARKVSHQS